MDATSFVINGRDVLGAYGTERAAVTAAQTLADNMEVNNSGATIHLLVTPWYGCVAGEPVHIYGRRA